MRLARSRDPLAFEAHDALETNAFGFAGAGGLDCGDEGVFPAAWFAAGTGAAGVTVSVSASASSHVIRSLSGRPSNSGANVPFRNCTSLALRSKFKAGARLWARSATKGPFRKVLGICPSGSRSHAMLASTASFDIGPRMRSGGMQSAMALSRLVMRGSGLSKGLSRKIQTSRLLKAAVASSNSRMEIWPSFQSAVEPYVPSIKQMNFGADRTLFKHITWMNSRLSSPPTIANSSFASISETQVGVPLH